MSDRLTPPLPILGPDLVMHCALHKLHCLRESERDHHLLGDRGNDGGRPDQARYQRRWLSQVRALSAVLGLSFFSCPTRPQAAPPSKSMALQWISYLRLSASSAAGSSRANAMADARDDSKGPE
jgi:hypothetical protein